jgi:hypothetical protein
LSKGWLWAQFQSRQGWHLTYVGLHGLAKILGAMKASPWNETEVEMKTLVSAIALLVGSNVLAVAGDQTLKLFARSGHPTIGF